MKNITLLLLVSTLIISNSYGQEDYLDGGGSPSWMDKVYVGGGLGGMSFSSTTTYISVSGMVGYNITEKLNTGVGINYQYINYKNFNQSYNNYGFNFFTQYQIYEPFFIMAQYDIYFMDYPEGRRNIDALLFGGGIKQALGNKGFLNFYALYNVLHNTVDVTENIYNSPWVIGMSVGVGF